MVEQALKLAQNFLFEKYYIFHAREDSQREMSLYTLTKMTRTFFTFTVLFCRKI